MTEQIELQAKLLNYFLGSNKSNINQSAKLRSRWYDARDGMAQTRRPDAGTGEYVSPLVVKYQNSGEPALMAVVATIDHGHSP